MKHEFKPGDRVVIMYPNENYPREPHNYFKEGEPLIVTVTTEFGDVECRRESPDNGISYPVHPSRLNFIGEKPKERTAYTRFNYTTYNSGNWIAMLEDKEIIKLIEVEPGNYACKYIDSTEWTMAIDSHLGMKAKDQTKYLTVMQKGVSISNINHKLRATTDIGVIKITHNGNKLLTAEIIS